MAAIRSVGLLTVALLASTTAFAMPMITVDGNTANWGVTVAESNGSDYGGLGGIVHEEAGSQVIDFACASARLRT